MAHKQRGKIIPGIKYVLTNAIQFTKVKLFYTIDNSMAHFVSINGLIVFRGLD